MSSASDYFGSDSPLLGEFRDRLATHGIDETDVRFPEDFSEDPVDLAVMRIAIEHCSTNRLVLAICRPYRLQIETAADPLYLPSNTHMLFTAGGALQWQAFGLPCLWMRDCINIRLYYPTIIFRGEAATTLPPANEEFYAEILGRTNHFPMRDAMAAIAVFGGLDIIVHSAQLGSEAFETSARAMQRGIVICDHDDRRPSSQCRITGATVLDGVTMGIVAWGVEGLEIEHVSSRRFGNLNVDIYTWEVACHAVYVTGQRPNKDVKAGLLLDSGAALTDTYWDNGPHSFKFIDVTGLSVDRIESNRDCGFLEVSGVDAYFGPILWATGSVGAIINVSPLNLPKPAEENGAGRSSDIRFTRTDIQLPFGALKRPVVTAIADGNEQTSVKDTDFGVIRIRGQINDIVPAVMIGTLEGCSGEIWLELDALHRKDVVLMRIDGGGRGNTFRFSVGKSLFDHVDVAELRSSGGQNWFYLRDTLEDRWRLLLAK